MTETDDTRQWRPLPLIRWAKVTSSMRELEQQWQNTITGEIVWRKVPWADE